MERANENSSATSFEDQLQRSCANSSGVHVINQQTTFFKSNDITNPYFNPVIHKIEHYMTKKEKKNSEQGSGGQPRLSFLSLRNLWTNPAAASVLDRSNTPAQTQNQTPQVREEVKEPVESASSPSALTLPSAAQCIEEPLCPSEGGESLHFNKTLSNINIMMGHQQREQEGTQASNLEDSLDINMCNTTNHQQQPAFGD